MTLRAGALVRLDTATKRGRPGVVVELLPSGQAKVAWGTGTLRPHLRHVAVVPHEAAGRALGLTKPTYFYQQSVWTGAPDAERLHGQLGTCPRYLLVALRALLRE